MNEVERLLSLPYKADWYPARQLDGNGYLVLEMGELLGNGQARMTVMASNLPQVDAEAVCITHNGRGFER